MAMIDTLKLAHRLEAVGFTAQQAEGQATALGEFLGETAATRADVELLIERAKNETIRWVASIVIGTSALQAVILAVLMKYLK